MQAGDLDLNSYGLLGATVSLRRFVATANRVATLALESLDF